MLYNILQTLIGNEQQPINEQYDVKKTEISSNQQASIQSLMNELEQQRSILKELQLKDEQYTSEIKLLKENNMKEIEDLKLQIEAGKTSSLEELEKTFEKKKSDLENEHQLAMENQHNETQLILRNINKDEIGTLGGEYSEEKKNEFIETFEKKLKDLESKYNAELKELQEQHEQKEKEIKLLKEEQEQQLISAKQQWKDQLNDIHQSIENLLSNNTSLEDPIRTKLSAEAKENQDKLLNAFAVSLRSLDISHQQAKDRLIKEHEEKVKSQKEKIKPLEDEQAQLEEQLKVIHLYIYIYNIKY